jgi:hypothetical protein
LRGEDLHSRFVSESNYKKETLMAKRNGGGVETLEALETQIEETQRERNAHMQAAESADAKLLRIYERLQGVLKASGKLPSGRQARSGDKGAVREDAGTGKILALIKDLAKNKVAKTADVVREAQKRHKIKYPHSSFQSLQDSGHIKLKTPQRGMITLLDK